MSTLVDYIVVLYQRPTASSFLAMDTTNIAVLFGVVAAAVLVAVTPIVATPIAERWYRPPGVITTQIEPGRGRKETYKCLYGPERYCHHVTRLKQPVLMSLIEELTERGGLDDHGKARVSVAEQVVIFCDFVAHNRSISDLERQYVHARRTFERIIDKVSVALCRMAEDYVQLPDDTAIHSILRNPKFSYFKGALGALDGTYINAVIPEERQSAWRCRKGFIAQNVLAVCDFSCNFLYALVGYEGSANDGTVVNRAFRVGGLRVPEGRYYLADGGYSPKDNRLLVPYQRTRYHLREQIASNAKPETKEELFNLRHAQLRNCVERIFGIVKKRFEYVRVGPYPGRSILDQKRILMACFVLHNFILAHGEQPLSTEPQLLQSDGYIGNDDVSGIEYKVPGFEEDEGMLKFRDEIAEDMWQDYLELLEHRGQDRTGIKQEW